MNTLAVALLTLLFWSPTQKGPDLLFSGLAREKESAGELDGQVTFSHAAGFYAEEFPLTLSARGAAATIIYTLDGSEPTEENLNGRVYTYKNRYPFNPGDPFGPLLMREMASHVYSGQLLIHDRSPEANQLSGISSTFYPNTYAPQTGIQKATVVRARTVRAGCSPGPVTTHTYFIGIPPRQDFTMISISIDEDQLFLYEDGIYVAGKDFDDWRSANPDARPDGFTPANYQRDDERRAHLEIFDGPEAQKVVDQDIGIKLSGNVSLYFPEKSLRLFARSEYGKSTIDYPVFPGLQQTSYKRITLRNSGNDNKYTLFRDAAIHESVKHLNFGTQAYRPAVVFINGEYWGIHNIREHLDKNYLESKYGVDPDNIDLLEPPEVQEGDLAHYQAMFQYLENHDLAIEENYEHILTAVDAVNFTDYQIAEIFSANTDWPGRNQRFWRTRTAEYEPDAPPGKDGRWRWLMKDMDVAFGLGATFRHNSLQAATNAGGNALPNPWWSTLLFRRLLENPGYRERFINRFADLLNTTFLPDRMASVIEKLRNNIASEIPDHIARWSEPRSVNAWTGNVNTMVEFVRSRPLHQRQHITTQFGLDGMHALTVNVSGAEKGFIHINTIDILGSTEGISADPYPWTGIYFEGVPVTMRAIERSGYRFIKWAEREPSETSEIKINLTESTSLTAVFARASDLVKRHSPYDGATKVPVVAAFEWASSGMATYDLQVSTTSDFESKVTDKLNIPGSRFLLEAGLKHDTDYFWRIKPHDATEWSEPWTFSTGPQPSEAPVVGLERTANPITLYPNPTQGEVVIVNPSPDPIISADLCDLTGKLLWSLPVQENTRMFSIDLSHHPKGFYLIVLQSALGTRMNRKVLVN